MNIQFTDAQLALLKEVLSEYAEDCYQSMFDFQHTAIDAQEDFLKKEYSALAQSEEARFNEVKELLSYIERFEELMKGVK